jgi:HSP20 family molecular chaperone IbpA
MPRLFGDLGDWFDMDLISRAGHTIRIEDSLTDTEYVLRAELPGLQPDKDIQVTVEEGILTVRAERHEEEHTRHRTEFRYGLLQRSIRLPAYADADKTKASYTDGILTVTVPLTAPPAGRKVPITG